MIALLILSIMAIFLGKYLSSRIDRMVITRVAGILFLLIGLSFLLSASLRLHLEDRRFDWPGGIALDVFATVIVVLFALDLGLIASLMS